MVRLGDIQALLGEISTAESSYREAIAELEGPVKTEPANTDFRSDLARAYHGQGVLLKDANRYAQSEQSLRKAIELRDEIVKGPNPKASDRQALADSRYQLGALLVRRGSKQAEDASAYESALEAQQDLVRQFGDRPEFRTKLARYRNNLAILQNATGKVQDAELTLRATLELMRPYLQAPTALPGARWQYARAANNLGAILVKGEPEEAGQQLRAAEEVLQSLTAEFAAIPQYHQELASIERNLGLLARRQGQVDAALNSFKVAAKLLEDLRAKSPNDPALRQKLALALVDQNEVLASKSPAEAEAALRKALDEQSAVVALFPDVPEYQINLARGFFQLASSLVKSNHPEDAVKQVEAALKIHRGVLQKEPGTRLIGRYIWEDLGVLIHCLIACHRVALAEPNVDEFVEMTPPDQISALNAAGLLVRCASAAAGTTEGKPLVEKFQSRAVKVLSGAVKSHVIRSTNVLEHQEFAPLRDREDFKRLFDALGQPAQTL
jgi:tetratricopeptide (TPR) repeat protein